MRQTFALFKILFIVFSWTTSPVLHAKTQSKQAAETQNRVDAQRALKRLQLAAQKLNYSGLFVYRQADHLRTSRITHVGEGTTELEKLEVLDGKARECIRNNDEIVCAVPEAKALFVEKRLTKDAFPAVTAASANDLSKSYVITSDASEEVAGRDCLTLQLSPKDRFRYGYKLSVDKATGLLLRVQTLSPAKEIIEQIAFTQIEIGNVDRSKVKSSFTDTSHWRVENASTIPTRLERWSFKSIPPGFKKVREIKRVVTANLEQGAQRSGQVTEREIAQIVFSDGLAAISIFIESGYLGGKEGPLQRGAMNIVSKRLGDFWLTIVGEVPAAAIEQVAKSIEFKAR